MKILITVLLLALSASSFASSLEHWSREKKAEAYQEYVEDMQREGETDIQDLDDFEYEYIYHEYEYEHENYIQDDEHMGFYEYFDSIQIQVQ